MNTNREHQNRDEIFKRLAGAFISEDRANTLLDAYRTEVIAERDEQTVAWLTKKADEYGNSNREKRAMAAAVACMASKLSRGAVRENNLQMPPRTERSYRDDTSLTPDREHEIRNTVLSDWPPGEWRTRFISGEHGDWYEVYTQTDNTETILVTLPDWAGPIATLLADARDAVPELLTELDQVREELAHARELLAAAQPALPPFRRVALAISDPGAYTPRGDNYQDGP